MSKADKDIDAFHKPFKWLRIDKNWGLENANNWTPKMIYIHRTRMLLGLIIGTTLGILVGIEL